jgi:polysaccharide chain length determinant protein (PEP-CTERM system associated)
MIQREWTPQDYITLLRRWRALILVAAVAGAILAYGVSRFLPNRYKSESTILVEQPTVPEQLVKPVVSSDINERLASMTEQIFSRTRLEPIIRQFGLYSEDINRASMEDLVRRLRSAIGVTPIHTLDENESGSSKIPGFHVSVIWDDPRTAQEVCTAVTSMFIQENIRARQQDSEDTTQFMVQELSDAKAKLDEQDAKLADFEAHHMGSLPDQAETNFGILTGLYSTLDASTQALTRAQMDKGLAQSMLTQQIAARRASQTGKNPETFGEQLAALQTQLASLQARYTDDYPDVVKTKIEIEALKKKIADSEGLNGGAELDADKKGTMEPLALIQLRAQIRTDDQIIAEKTNQQERIQEQIKAAQARVQSTPEVAQQYKQLTRDYQTALDFYKELLNKRAQSAMATDLERRQEGERFTPLDPANLPDKPAFPNRPEFALGGFGGGLVLGLGLAFLLEMRDTSLRTERDVEFSLQLPVLAIVPAFEHWSGKNVKEAAGRLVANSDIGVGAGT